MLLPDFGGMPPSQKKERLDSIPLDLLSIIIEENHAVIRATVLRGVCKTWMQLVENILKQLYGKDLCTYLTAMRIHASIDLLPKRWIISYASFPRRTTLVQYKCPMCGTHRHSFLDTECCHIHRKKKMTRIRNAILGPALSFSFLTGLSLKTWSLNGV